MKARINRGSGKRTEALNQSMDGWMDGTMNQSMHAVIDSKKMNRHH